MRQSKKDKRVIINKETGIHVAIFEMNEEEKANHYLERLQEEDLKYFQNPKHELKILNGYWNNGFYSNRL